MFGDKKKKVDEIEREMRELGMIRDTKRADNAGDESVARTVDDELVKLGWSPNARLSLLGDLGRENNWNRKTIFGGHNDPKNSAFNRGIISWQGDRRKKLENYLKKQGVFGRNDDEELRAMVRFMDDEMKSSDEWKDIHGAVRNPNISTYDASENLRKYIKYDPNKPYNTFDKEFRVKNNADWARRARRLGLGTNKQNTFDFDKFSAELLGTPQATEKKDVFDFDAFAAELTGKPPTVNTEQTSVTKPLAGTIDDLVKDKKPFIQPSPTNPVNIAPEAKTEKLAVPPSRQYTKRQIKPGDRYFEFEQTGKSGDLEYLGMADGKYYARNADGDEFELEQSGEQARWKPTSQFPKKLGGGKYTKIDDTGKYKSGDGDEYQFFIEEKDGEKSYVPKLLSEYPKSVTLNDGKVLTRTDKAVGEYADNEGRIYTKKGDKFSYNAADWLTGKTQPVTEPKNKETYEIFRKNYNLKDTEELRKKYNASYEKGFSKEDQQILNSTQPVTPDGAAQSMKASKLPVLKSVPEVARSYNFEETGVLELPMTEKGVGASFKYDKANQQNLKEGEYRVTDDQGSPFIFNPETGTLQDELQTRVVKEIPIDLPERGSITASLAKKAEGQKVADALYADNIISRDEVDEQTAVEFFSQNIRDFNTQEALPEEKLFKFFDENKEIVKDTYYVTERDINRLKEFSAKKKKIESDYSQALAFYQNKESDSYIARRKAQMEAGMIDRAFGEKEIAEYQTRLEKTIQEMRQTYLGNEGFQGLTKADIEQIAQERARQTLTNDIKTYGSLAGKIEAEQKWAKLSTLEKSKEIGKSFLKVVPDTLSAIYKTAGIAESGLRWLNSATAGKPEWTPVDKTYLYYVGDIAEDFRDAYIPQRPEARESYLATAANGFGQVLSQAFAAYTSGGMTLPTAMIASQGFSGQYDEARQSGATEEQRVLAGIIGIGAAAPDILITRGWFKGLTNVEKAGFISNLSKNLYTNLSKKYGEAEAKSLVGKAMQGFFLRAEQIGGRWFAKETLEEAQKITLRVAGKNVLKGTVKESAQEFGENKINKIAEKYIYNPKVTWTEIASITDEDIHSIIGGLAGGAFGGGLQSYVQFLQQKRTEEASTLLKELLDKGEIDGSEFEKIKAVGERFSTDPNAKEYQKPKTLDYLKNPVSAFRQKTRAKDADENTIEFVQGLDESDNLIKENYVVPPELRPLKTEIDRLREKSYELLDRLYEGTEKMSSEEESRILEGRQDIKNEYDANEELINAKSNELLEKLRNYGVKPEVNADDRIEPVVQAITNAKKGDSDDVSPEPEREVTLSAQRKALLDRKKPSAIGVLYTDGERTPDLEYDWIKEISTPDGVLHVSIPKLKKWFEANNKGAEFNREEVLSQLEDGTIPVADILGKVYDTKDTSVENNPIAVATVDKDGNELDATVLDVSKEIQPQAERQAESGNQRFGDDTESVIVPSAEVVQSRRENRPLNRTLTERVKRFEPKQTSEIQEQAASENESDASEIESQAQTETVENPELASRRKWLTDTANKPFAVGDTILANGLTGGKITKKLGIEKGEQIFEVERATGGKIAYGETELQQAFQDGTAFSTARAVRSEINEQAQNINQPAQMRETEVDKKPAKTNTAEVSAPVKVKGLHGTQERIQGVLRPADGSANPTYGNVPDSGLGIFYTDNPVMAKWFAGAVEFNPDSGTYEKTENKKSQIISEDLEFKRPYVIDKNNSQYDADNDYDSVQIYFDEIEKAGGVENYRNQLLAKGFDGIVLRDATTNYYEDGKTYSVYVKFPDLAEKYAKSQTDEKVTKLSSDKSAEDNFADESSDLSETVTIDNTSVTIKKNPSAKGAAIRFIDSNGDEKTVGDLSRMLSPAELKDLTGKLIELKNRSAENKTDELDDLIQKLTEIPQKNEKPLEQKIESANTEKAEQKSVDKQSEQAQNIEDEQKTKQIREPRQPKSRTAQGKKTRVKIPDSEKAYEGNYTVREIGDVIPSHNPFNFQPNPDYYFVNDRRYDREKQYQEQVRERSKPEKFDASQLINNSPTVEVGTPVIDADGNVLGGNSRAMMLHRIFKDNGKAKENYLELLKEDAPVFGLTASDIEGFEQPVLVRELNDASIDKQAAITELNKTSTTALTSAERAVSEANLLSDEAVDFITRQIEKAGTDATLTDAMNLYGASIINKLIEDGVFTSGERNVLLDGGKITPDGKQRIERMLFGRIFEDLEQYEFAPPYLKRNLARTVPSLIKTSADKDWNILTETREAIDLLTEFSGKGSRLSLENYADQPNMLRPQGWGAKALQIAERLRESPNSVSNTFKGYAKEYQNAKDGTSLFGALTPKEAFSQLFGTDTALMSASDMPQREIEAVKEVRDSQGRLLAPNGKPSNLPEHLWKTVRTPSFLNWFGDWINSPESASKVVDENGEPLIVYHGTAGDFDVFQKGFSRYGSGNSVSAIGYWFTNIPDVANGFADFAVNGNKNVLPVFLRLTNPKTYKPLSNEELENRKAKIENIEKELTANRQRQRELNKERGALPYEELYENGFKGSERVQKIRKEEEQLNQREKELQLERNDAKLDDPYEQLMADRDEFVERMQELPRRRGTYKGHMAEKNSKEANAELIQNLKNQDYDGILIKSSAYDIEEGVADQIIAFEPNQIKSIFNRGTFSPDEDSILFKLRDRDSQTYYNETLPFVPTADLVTQVTGGEIVDGNFTGDEHDFEIIRRLHAEDVFRRTGRETDIQTFDGVVFDAAKLRRLAAIGKESGYTEKGFADLLNTLDEFADTVEDYGALYLFDDALAEELVHLEDLRAGRTDAQARDILTKSPFFTAKGKFKQQYGTKSVADQISEIAAKLLTDQAEKYGWTDIENFEAEKEKFLNEWSDGIIRRNKIDTIEKFNDFKQKYTRITEYADIEKINQRGSGKSQRERSDDGLSRKESEGKQKRAEPGQAENQPLSAEEEVKRKKAAFSRILGTDYYYDPQSHEQTKAKAEQLLSTEESVQSAAWKVLNDSKPSAEAMQIVYWELERLNGLADSYLEEGKETEFAAVATQIAELSAAIVQRQVAAGQEVEIAKTLAPLSPEAAILTAQKIKAYAKEGAQLTQPETETITRIQGDLRKANEQLQTAQRKINNANATIRRMKDEREKTPRKTTTAQDKLLKQYKTKEKDILAALREKFPDSPMFNGKEAALMMVAWHGSPHRFDKFDISKIGTGEGAQAYGYGLYFTDKEAVAEHYRRQLSITTVKQNSKRIQTDTDAKDKAVRAVEVTGSVKKGIDKLRQYEEENRSEYASDLYKNARLWLTAYADEITVHQEGAKYRVDLKPKDDEYLLWDKPLSEQSEKVLKAVGKYSEDLITRRNELAELDKQTPRDEENFARYMKANADYVRFREENGLDIDGEQFYKQASKEQGSDNKASEYLKSLGIRGIKYLDGTSRGKGEGDYNYVIFDDADVEIEEVLYSKSDTPLDAETANLLTEYTVGQILQGKAYDDLLAELAEISNAPLEDIRRVHAEAVSIIKPAPKPMTESAKAKIKIRNEHYEKADEFTDPDRKARQTLDAARKRLEKQIESLAQEIATGEKQERESNTPTSPEIEDLKMRRDELKKQRDEIFGDKELSESERINRAEKALEKQIKNLQDKIAKNDYTRKEKAKQLDSDTLRQLRKTRDELKTQISQNTLSGIAQDALANGLDEQVVFAVNLLTGDEIKSINNVISSIAKEFNLSLEKAREIAQTAKDEVAKIRAERRKAADEAKNITVEQRAEMNEARKMKARATFELNQFLASIARMQPPIRNAQNVVTKVLNEYALINRRNNNVLRAAFINNWTTQLRNVMQAATITMPVEHLLLDVLETSIKATGLNVGDSPDIRLKDIWLPLAYRKGANRQLAELALSFDPEIYFKIMNGLQGGDVTLENAAYAPEAVFGTKTIHKALDLADKFNDKMSHISGAKFQEHLFRAASFGATVDQIIRRKSKGEYTLKGVLENPDLNYRDYISEKDAEFAADKALSVTYASAMDDPMGRKLKQMYDKLDYFLPLLFNPVTYARFTYATTKIAVANPLLLGLLDTKAMGGKGYSSRSIAKGVLGWSGVVIAYGLMSAFGGDDDKWNTLKIGGVWIDVKYLFPLSSYFYVAHLIKSFGKGTLQDEISYEKLLEGFASLELDYYQYGAGMEFLKTVRSNVAGTKNISDTGASSARLLASYFSGLLRFVKPAKDILSTFDAEERYFREYDDSAKDKFVKEMAKSLPGLARMYNAPVQRDAVTDEKLEAIYPILRPFGINIIHPSFIAPEDSAATVWANKLFAQNFGDSSMTAEERRAYAIRKRLRNAVRSNEITAKQAAERIKTLVKEMRLTEQSGERLADELKYSELGAKIKQAFGMTDKKDIENLRTVWSYATDAEKDELRKILNEKKGRTDEFDAEFGLTGERPGAKKQRREDLIRTLVEAKTKGENIYPQIREAIKNKTLPQTVAQRIAQGKSVEEIKIIDADKPEEAVEIFNEQIVLADEKRKRSLINTMREKFDRAKMAENKSKFLLALKPHIPESEYNGRLRAVRDD